MNQFNRIKIYSAFTQQQDTNSTQISKDCQLGDTGTYPRMWNKTQKFHGLNIEIILSLFSYHCGITLEVSIKRHLKIPDTVSSAMWHLPRGIFDLSVEILNKVRRLRKHTAIAEKKAFKWEINTRDTLKPPCVWKLNVQF